MEPSETPLDAAARQVIEGEERLTRQRLIIAELERDGHDSSLPGAQALLVTMEDSQDLARQHLQREQRKAAAAAGDSRVD